MSTTLSDNLCPCGSGHLLENCCQPFFADFAAPTAETLMRSRYTAYTLKNYPYLIATTHPEQQLLLKNQKLYEQAPQMLWQQLEIIDTEGGLAHDTTGIVEFKAWFKETVSGPVSAHQERSSFIKLENRWFFTYPNLPFANQKTQERNAPCPCGSGKKYKKCCQ